jgi:hypothetical protein
MVRTISSTTPPITRISHPLMPKLLGKIEYADYQAGDAASGKVDLTRVWVTLIFNY